MGIFEGVRNVFNPPKDINEFIKHDGSDPKTLSKLTDQSWITGSDFDKAISTGKDKAFAAMLDNGQGIEAFNQENMDKLLEVSKPIEGKLNKKGAKEENKIKNTMLKTVIDHKQDFQNNDRNRGEDSKPFTLEGPHVSQAIKNGNFGAVKALYKNAENLFSTKSFNEMADYGTKDMVQYVLRKEKEAKVTPGKSGFQSEAIDSAIKGSNQEVFKEFLGNKNMQQKFNADNLTTALNADYNYAIEKIVKKDPGFVTSDSFNIAIEHGNREAFDDLRRSKGGEKKLTEDNLTKAIETHNGLNTEAQPQEAKSATQERSNNMKTSLGIVDKIVDKHPKLVTSDHITSYIEASNLGGVELLTGGKEKGRQVNAGHITAAIENDVSIDLLKHLTTSKGSLNRDKLIGEKHLMKAIDKDNTEALTRLAEKNPKAITLDAAKHAIDTGNEAQLDVLMDKNKDLFHDKETGKEIISHAIKRGNTEMFSNIVRDTKGTINKTNNTGLLTEEHLTEAIESGNTEIIQKIATTKKDNIDLTHFEKAAQNPDALTALASANEQRTQKAVKGAMNNDNNELLSLLLENEKVMSSLSNKDKDNVSKYLDKNIKELTKEIKDSPNDISSEDFQPLQEKKELLQKTSEHLNDNMTEGKLSKDLSTSLESLNKEAVKLEKAVDFGNAISSKASSKESLAELAGNQRNTEDTKSIDSGFDEVDGPGNIYETALYGQGNQEQESIYEEVDKKPDMQAQNKPLPPEPTDQNINEVQNPGQGRALLPEPTEQKAESLYVNAQELYAEAKKPSGTEQAPTEDQQTQNVSAKENQANTSSFAEQLQAQKAKMNIRAESSPVDNPPSNTIASKLKEALAKRNLTKSDSGIGSQNFPPQGMENAVKGIVNDLAEGIKSDGQTAPDQLAAGTHQAQTNDTVRGR